MSPARPEKDASKPILNDEVPFSFQELFFSRTNQKGHILSGNDVFQRVSNFSWDELLHKPHNIIRHPDMPRAVFWLLWETIKDGKPVGAYVKNRAKDGRYYWVFAIVTPIEGGYLSVRLKPASDLFAVVEKEYATLRQEELKTRPKPAVSAQRLLSRLQELGFRDYDAFMATAISREIAARDRETNREKDICIHQFDNLVSSAKCLVDHVNAIFGAYEGNQYVPLNLSVQAAQLGDVGAPMCAISNNYTTISRQVAAEMKEFQDACKRVAQTIDEGLFLIGTARIQREVVEVFRQGLTENSTENQKEMAELATQERSSSQKASAGLQAIAMQINRFQQTCTDMKKLAASLEITRIMGKIESANLETPLTSLNVLIDELGDFQDAVLGGLKAIDQTNKQIQTDVAQLLRVA